MASTRNLKQKEKILLNPEEEVYVPLPSFLSVLGTDSNILCTIKRLSDNTEKYICTSDENEILRCMVLYILDNCIDQIIVLYGGRSSSGHHNLAFFDDILKDRTKNVNSLNFEPIYDTDTAEPFKVAFRRKQFNKLFSDR